MKSLVLSTPEHQEKVKASVSQSASCSLVPRDGKNRDIAAHGLEGEVR